MSKKLFALFILLSLCLCAVSCDTDAGGESDLPSAVSENESDCVSDNTVKADTIPPAFIDAEDGVLPAVKHGIGEEFSAENIVVRDNSTPDDEITVTVTDNGGYDPNVPGTYTFTVQATDASGNSATVTVEVTVEDNTAVQVKSIVLDNYAVNSETALSYTSSGTSFRTADVIQVMDKATFVSQYNQYSADHTNNGNVPFFPNGVIIITDADYNIVQVRIAAGENIQMDSDGTVKNSGFNWTNSIDAANGGGMFKGIIKDLDTLIPDGGYLFFVGNPGDQTCRTFLIRSLFCSTYESGGITVDACDVDISNAKIELAD